MSFITLLHLNLVKGGLTMSSLLRQANWITYKVIFLFFIASGAFPTHPICDVWDVCYRKVTWGTNYWEGRWLVARLTQFLSRFTEYLLRHSCQHVIRRLSIFELFSCLRSKFFVGQSPLDCVSCHTLPIQFHFGAARDVHKLIEEINWTRYCL